METKAATHAFAALSQETRLGIFRLLVRVGPNGLTAGEVAQQMGVPASTLSHHLAVLERAGLLRSWRVQRHIHYASDYEGTRQLLSFLVEDCCAGRPELCGGGLLEMANHCPDPVSADACAPDACGPDTCGVPAAGGSDD